VAQVAKHLTSKCEALSSDSSTAKKKKKELTILGDSVGLENIPGPGTRSVGPQNRQWIVGDSPGTQRKDKGCDTCSAVLTNLVFLPVM
jgi:hypothetical protein